MPRGRGEGGEKSRMVTVGWREGEERKRKEGQITDYSGKDSEQPSINTLFLVCLQTVFSAMVNFRVIGKRAKK